ncbi:MAG: hypothetical protein FJ405_16990 [Verrucomicrobia bacterium]|nr:hypothetical protein [Verrucomicrobiota bacterium]
MKNAFRILGFVLSLLGSSASGEVRSWKGGGESGLWSLAANWSNGIPQNRDSILLPRHPLGFTTSAINDLTNIVIARIICESQRYTLTVGKSS